MKPSRIRGLAGLATILAIVLALSACGGSASPSSTTAAAQVNPTGSSGPTGGTPGGSAATARRTALAACLKKYGVTLPAGRFGGGRPRFGASGASGATGRFGPTGRFGATRARGRGFFGGGAFAGNPRFAAAIAKCGGAFGGAGRAGAAPGFNVASAQDRAEVTSFVACMKSNGVALPAPNFSGTGSVFGTSVNRTTAAYRAAYAKCQGLLRFLAPAAARGSTGSPAA